MTEPVKKVGVLGAGVMGSGIAAHLANAGVRVVLLDVVIDKADKNKLAREGVAKALKARPAAFFHPRFADLIEVGNLDDDLAKLGGCDWVIEAVKEDVEVKRALFARVDAVRGNAIVTTNTSGLPIRSLVEGRSPGFREAFFVTHFFNPVRYMTLLEIVAGEATNRDALKRVVDFSAVWLGKGIVYGKDTPNFIANRIGCYAIMSVLRAMGEGGYSVEEIDAVFGTPLGRPKSAVFRTADMVGLDTFVHVSKNCYANLPGDEERDVFKVPAYLEDMVRRGWIGDKGGQGFYKKVGSDISALDLKTMEYAPSKKIRFDSIGAVRNVDDVKERIRLMVNATDRAGEIAWRVTAETLAYTARRVGEIADDIVNIDRAMRWGYNWALGPFEMWDAIGVEASIERMDKAGIKVPANIKAMLKSGRKSFYEGLKDGAATYCDLGAKRPIAVPPLPRALRLGGTPIVKEKVGAVLRDLGDGVLCVEFRTKMNAVDDDILGMLNEAVDEAEKNYAGIVVGNEAESAFSAGANLMLIWMLSQQKQWSEIERAALMFQGVTRRLHTATVPVVAAPFGLALGGGCEVALGCTAIRANAELYMGLVEVGAGVIPAGGGCRMMLDRWLGDLAEGVDPLQYVRKVFEIIGMAKVSMSAEEARAYHFLNERDGVTMNRDQLIHDAKETVLGLARAGYRPAPARALRLPGESGYATIRAGLWAMVKSNQISEHDALIGSKLAKILTGGTVGPNTIVSEERLFELEREAFLSLCGEEKSQARMQALLTSGKPLRN